MSDGGQQGAPESNQERRAQLGAVFSRHAFSQWGWAQLSRPYSMELYDAALADGRMADLEYLRVHRDMKEDVRKYRAWARSAFVVTKNYVTHPYPAAGSSDLLDSAAIAAYARGRDYHNDLKNELTQLASDLQVLWPEAVFTVCTDSSPILERDLAVRAGLGWIGKNACLIDRTAGSFNLIGEVLCSIDCDWPAPDGWANVDFCGTCTRCIEACPTQALTAPRVLDARKCISYWTIEAKGDPPVELRSKMGDWLFGCDICQTVCPWNIRRDGKTLAQWETQASDRARLIADLEFVLQASNSALERQLDSSPLMRRGGWALKRNALRIIGARRLVELAELVKRYLQDPKLGSMALWAESQLAPPIQA